MIVMMNVSSSLTRLPLPLIRNSTIVVKVDVSVVIVIGRKRGGERGRERHHDALLSIVHSRSCTTTNVVVDDSIVLQHDEVVPGLIG
jgi:hypothetical protein